MTTDCEADDHLVPAFLAGQAWFSRLPNDLRRRTLKSARSFMAQKGQRIIEQGQDADGWYAVLDGLVKLERSVDNGSTSAFVGVPSGEWFGEGSLSAGAPHAFHAVALRDTQLLHIPHAVFATLREECMAFNQWLAWQLNQRLVQAMMIIEVDRGRAPERRIALRLSKIFWGERRVIRLSQGQLAELAGMVRQTSHRALKDLQRRGWIEMRVGRLRVVQPDRLLDFALGKSPCRAGEGPRAASHD